LLLWGGGDLASGIALRLHHAGIHLIIIELPEPIVVRRLVSFAEAVFRDEFSVEDVTARLVSNIHNALTTLEQRYIPVLVDPQMKSLLELRATVAKDTPIVLIDCRLMKHRPDTSLESADFVIGLGPGYIAAKNCHAAIETNRGHSLGRVIWQGAPEANTGIPDSVNNYKSERVLRSPSDGMFIVHADIGDHLEKDQIVAEVNSRSVLAPFKGVLRGLLQSGIRVWKGLKIGDVDPRDDPCYCALSWDKSLAIGGGVLEAILSRPELCPHIWD
jgi:xanthine dehydrogenase accessory factor